MNETSKLIEVKHILRALLNNLDMSELLHELEQIAYDISSKAMHEKEDKEWYAVYAILNQAAKDAKVFNH